MMRTLRNGSWNTEGGKLDRRLRLGRQANTQARLTYLTLEKLVTYCMCADKDGAFIILHTNRNHEAFSITWTWLEHKHLGIVRGFWFTSCRKILYPTYQTVHLSRLLRFTVFRKIKVTIALCSHVHWRAFGAWALLFLWNLILWDFAGRKTDV